MNEPTSEIEAFNPAWLMESCGEDDAAIRELIGLFVTQATRLWSDLARAVKGSDWETAARVAHKMAGSCGACGLPALERALRDFETAAAIDPASAPGPWPEVIRQAARAADALNSRFKVGWTPRPEGSGKA